MLRYQCQWTGCSDDILSFSSFQLHAVRHCRLGGRRLFKTCRWLDCKDAFLYGDELRSHMYEHCGRHALERYPTIPMLKCDYCKKHFFHRRELTTHIVRKHLDERTKKEYLDGMKRGKADLKCVEEGCKRPRKYVRFGSLKLHLERVHQLQNVCEASYRQHMALVASNPHKKTHPCPEEGCRKVFNYSNHLAGHVKLHELKKERRFMETVPPEAMHPCEVEGCNQRFLQRADNLMHRRLVHGLYYPVYYTCKVAGCLVVCKTKKLYLAHVRSHEQKPKLPLLRPLRCPLRCRYRFKTYLKFERHVFSFGPHLEHFWTEWRLNNVPKPLVMNRRQKKLFKIDKTNQRYPAFPVSFSTDRSGIRFNPQLHKHSLMYNHCIARLMAYSIIKSLPDDFCTPDEDPEDVTSNDVSVIEIVNDIDKSVEEVDGGDNTVPCKTSGKQDDHNMRNVTKQCGFDKGWKVKTVIGIEGPNPTLFTVLWEESRVLENVPADLVKSRAPAAVIEYYQAIMPIVNVAMEVSEKEVDPAAEPSEAVNMKKEVRHRKKHFYNQLRRQMEFYFSDANLTKNRFMGQQVLKDPNVDLSLFLTFNKIRALTMSVEDIAKALKKSETLAVTEDGTKVYRTTPVRENENTDDCTIYVEQLPPDAEHEWLKNVFLPYGNVPYVSIPKYHVSRTNKGFAFVEFESPEAADRALEAFGAMGCRIGPQVQPDQLCSNVVAEGEKPVEEEPVEEEPVEVEPISGEKKAVDMFEDGEAAVMDVEEMKEASEKGIDEKEEKSEAGGITKEINDSAKKKKKKSKELDEEIVFNDVKAEDDGESSEVINKRCKKSKNKKGDSEVNEIEKEAKTTRKRKGERGDDEVETEQKKAKRGSDDDGEEGNGEEGEKENEEVTEGEEKKKKKGRRHKKKKTRKEEPEVDPRRNLRVLSKVEWKRLRNKYLSIQKARMISLKQNLARSRWGSNYSQDPRDASQRFSQRDNSQRDNLQRDNSQRDNLQRDGSQRDNSQRDNSQRDASQREQSQPEKTKKQLSFIPDVIVHVRMDEPVADEKIFKAGARSHGDVLYVDLNAGADEAFIRCGSSDGAARLVAEAPWRRMDVLRGDDEKAYWEKITRDRDQKLNIGGVGRTIKRRGRDKLLKKAEKALGKHIRFEEHE